MKNKLTAAVALVYALAVLTPLALAADTAKKTSGVPMGKPKVVKIAENKTAGTIDNIKPDSTEITIITPDGAKKTFVLNEKTEKPTTPFMTGNKVTVHFAADDKSDKPVATKITLKKQD